MWYNIMVRNYANIRLHGLRVQATVIDRKKVEFLSKEAISRVLSTEAEANAIRERAQEQAHEMVNACEANQSKESAEAIAKATAEMKVRQTMVKDRAEALITRSREEAGADIEALQTAAREKMREAVKHIEWELCDI